MSAVERMKKKLFVVTTCLGLLAGCGTPYTPPAGGPQAAVEFRLYSNAGNAGVYAWRSRACDAPRKIAQLERSPDKPLAYKHETSVAAGEEFVVTIKSVDPDGAYVLICQSTVVFTPVAGRSYMVEFDRQYGKCLARVMERDPVTYRDEPASTASAFPPDCKA